jgi:hypothetical protein
VEVTDASALQACETRPSGHQVTGPNTPAASAGTTRVSTTHSAADWDSPAVPDIAHDIHCGGRHAEGVFYISLEPDAPDILQAPLRRLLGNDVDTDARVREGQRIREANAGRGPHDGPIRASDHRFAHVVGRLPFPSGLDAALAS